MKFSLVVQTEGKASGKSIPISGAQFVIGRDPQCQLRPASALISKRHCALITRGAKHFVRDFESTNGTFVNEDPVKGERELHDQDILKVGPLVFRVAIEAAGVPVDKKTPLPKPIAPRGTASDDDESVGAMLLDLGDDAKSDTPDPGAVPEGSTIMEGLPADLAAQETGQGMAKEGTAKEGKRTEKKKNDGDTSAAAEAILQKYMRRQRS